MLTEIIIALGVLVVGSGILIDVLALLYGKDRPIKLYLPVFPARSSRRSTRSPSRRIFWP